MAKAITVSYGRLATFGRFENEKISLTVELAEGETADQGLDQARKWVEAALAERDHLSESITELQTRVAELQGMEGRLSHVIEDARKILKVMDIPILELTKEQAAMICEPAEEDEEDEEDDKTLLEEDEGTDEEDLPIPL